MRYGLLSDLLDLLCLLGSKLVAPTQRRMEEPGREALVHQGL